MGPVGRTTTAEDVVVSAFAFTMGQIHIKEEVLTLQQSGRTFESRYAGQQRGAWSGGQEDGLFDGFAGGVKYKGEIPLIASAHIATGRALAANRSLLIALRKTGSVAQPGGELVERTTTTYTFFASPTGATALALAGNANHGSTDRRRRWSWRRC